ncbi:MAG: right-handed parallel beta-helix repeat-containing protein, partial [Paraglaciecola sp.]
PLAIGELFHVNLKELGITDYGSLTAKKDRLDLLFDNEPLTLARWPNQSQEQAIISSVLVNEPTSSNNGDTVGDIVYDHDRAQYWVNEPALLAQGYWFWNWSSQIQEVESLDTENKVMHLSEPYHYYGYRAGQRYFVLNALYELDTPGEWYLNRDTGDLYFWPLSEPTDDSVVQVSITKNLLTFENASRITLEGLQFSGSRGNAIEVLNGINITIKRCKINNSGAKAIYIQGGESHSVEGCDIANTGEGAISLYGGDRTTLTPSNHQAINNYIHNFSRLYRTYTPAIELNGVGAIARNNTIHNGPHTSLMITGNDHLVEYNEIFDVTYETSDVGAIYSGRDWTARGNVIQNNYLHHITGYSGSNIIAVYLDDQASGFTIKNNLFYKTGKSTFVGGGDDNIIEDNVYISSRVAVHIDSRGLTWQGENTSGAEQLLDKLNAVPYTSAIWTTSYPELIPSLDNPWDAVGNVVSNNTSNTPLQINVSTEAEELSDISDNTVSGDMSISISNHNISNISSPLINLNAIGVFKGENRATWPINKYQRVTEN